MHSEEVSGATTGMNRRRFLKLGGTGVAGAALLGVAGSGCVLAREPSPHAPSLGAEFEEAAGEFGVPEGAAARHGLSEKSRKRVGRAVLRR